MQYTPCGIRWSLLLSVGLLAGCSTDGHNSVFGVEGSDRAADGLLSNPDLQTIVEYQLERDASAILSFLRHDDPKVRARAAFALASVQDSATAADLVTALRDPDARVRSDAAFAVGQVADSACTDTLLALLGTEGDPTVRARIAEAIGKTGGSAHLAAFLQADRVDPQDRALAIARFGIREIHHAAATTWLADHLLAADPLVRRNAAYYFGRITDTDAWLPALESVRIALDSLESGDPAAMHLVRGLGRIESTDDLARVIERLQTDSDWRTRATAATVLGSMGRDDRARRALTRALDDDQGHVVVSAATALTSLAPLTAQERNTLIGWVTNFPRHAGLRGRVLLALAAGGGGDFVLDWFHRNRGASPATIAEAIPALVPIDDPAALAALESLSADRSPSVNVAALQALRSRWAARGESEPTDRYYLAFRTALTSDDPRLIAVASPALGQKVFQPLGAVSTLTAAYRRLTGGDSEPARLAILRALGASENADARPALQAAADDPDPRIREEANHSLERLEGRLPGPAAGSSRPREPIDWERLAEIGPDPRLRIGLRHGDVVVQLDTEQAPLTVQAIVTFAEQGRYDGVPFHRVIANFVAQGGNVSSGDNPTDPEFLLRSEFTRIPYERGVIGMASAGKDTETSQYFVTHSMQPHLDGGYTAFGWVVSGWEVLDAILQNDRAIHVTVEP